MSEQGGLVEKIKQWFRDYNSDDRADAGQRMARLLLIAAVIIAVLYGLSQLGN